VENMADSIQLSQGEASSAKGRITSKSSSWLGNMSTLEKEVNTMANWFKGDTGNALLGLYQRCQADIKKEIEKFITEYNQTIDKAVSSLQSADAQVASSINNM